MPESRSRILRAVPDDALVLDVGGWARPLARADWVLDLMPYETRGLYGSADQEPERFAASTWVERDICTREPWPFADGHFDFVVCSHTLEDVRDPVWVCEELQRVGRAGYIEVPSRLEEQSFGVHGPWVGWSHHHWLVDVGHGSIDFVLKPHMLTGRPDMHFPGSFAQALTDAQRVQRLFWEGSFACRERIFHEPSDLDAYLRDFVSSHLEKRHARIGRLAGLGRRLGVGRGC